MKNKISKLIFVLVGIIAIYLLRTIFSEYNLKKTVSACVMAQRTSESFDPQKAKKFCEEKIKKKKED